MSTYSIAVIVGSLRRESFNRKLADAITKLAPPELSFTFPAIGEGSRGVLQGWMDVFSAWVGRFN